MLSEIFLRFRIVSENSCLVSNGLKYGIIVYSLLINQNINVSKRRKGIGDKKKSHSHKSPKRLEIKRLMLAEKAKKKKQK